MRKTYKILAALALVIIIGYQTSVVLLSHVHIVGKNLVVHYHPFVAGEKHTHTHSDDELSLIQNLFPTIVSLVALAFFFSVILAQKKVLETFCEIGLNVTKIVVNYNRGPPSLA